MAPSGCGFSRKMRLLKTDDFSSVFSLRCAVTGTWFQVLGRDNRGELPRLGLVVGRKTDRRAVVRNRIKRMVRETFRLNQASLAGLDLVVRARKAFLLQEKESARAELLVLFRRIQKCRI